MVCSAALVGFRDCRQDRRRKSRAWMRTGCRQRGMREAERWMGGNGRCTRKEASTEDGRRERKERKRKALQNRDKKREQQERRKQRTSVRCVFVRVSDLLGGSILSLLLFASRSLARSPHSPSQCCCVCLQHSCPYLLCSHSIFSCWLHWRPVNRTLDLTWLIASRESG